MKADLSTLVLSIATCKLIFHGTYVIEYSASFNPYLISITSFELNLLPYPNTAAPKFTGTLRSEIDVIVGTATSFKLPSSKDPDGDPFTIEVTYVSEDSFPSFINFDYMKQEF